MNYIQGENRQQYTMFPNVMEDYIDESNLARFIDAFVDSLVIKELGFDKSELSDTGRPPYSPQDMLKLYIYGYFNRIRSSRRLETETKRNIEVIWLLKKTYHLTTKLFQDSVLLTEFVKVCWTIYCTRN